MERCKQGRRGAPGTGMSDQQDTNQDGRRDYVFWRNVALALVGGLLFLLLIWGVVLIAVWL